MTDKPASDSASVKSDELAFNHANETIGKYMETETQLQARITELEGERDEWKDTAVERQKLCDHWASEASALREALKIVWDGVPERTVEAVKTNEPSFRNETAHVIVFTSENLRQIWAALQTHAGAAKGAE